jgi:hypothetical protein
MIARCFNKNNAHYKDYGGRGITVCDKWLTFEGFYEDMGDPPDKLSIHRKNNDKNYCKENCIWADRFVQARNTRSNIFLDFNGERKTVTEWAHDFNLNPPTLFSRLFGNNPWPLEKALNTPARKRNE